MSGDGLTTTTDLSQSNTVSNIESVGESKSPVNVFSQLSRLLSEEEMKNNPGALKLVLSIVDDLQDKIKLLEKYRIDYYNELRISEVKSEKIKSISSSINGRTIMIGIGGAGFGLVPSIWSVPNFFWPLLALSLILLYIGYTSNYLIKDL